MTAARTALALVEPPILDHFVERPHLGCAYLIASCAERGQRVRLVRGQTRFFADTLLRDGDELYELVMGLDPDEARGLRLAPIRETLAEQGPERFAADLRDTYECAVAARQLRNTFDVEAGVRLAEYRALTQIVVDHYLEERGRDDLRIVERYVADILADDPGVVGFSVHGSFDPLSRAVRRRVRALSDATILVGGSQSSFVATIGFTRRVFEHEVFDALVVGEAESTLPALLDALERGADPVSVGDVYVCRDGEVVGSHTAPHDVLDELLAPDYSQFDLDLYAAPNRVLPLMTARGCTWRKCTFCSHHATYGDNYRGHSIERFTGLVATLAERYGCRHFVVQDEELPPARARKVAQAIIDAGLDDLTYYTYGRLGKGYDDPRLAALLARAGFRSYQWGLESGSQRVLDLMCKGTQVPVMERILQEFAAAGIANQVCTFVGFPGERREDAQETLDFMERNHEAIARMGMGTFTISALSPVHQHPERWGVTYDKSGAYTVKAGMDHEEAQDFTESFLRKHAFEPRRWTTGVACLPAGLHARVLMFLCASYGVLQPDEAAALLADGGAGALYPLLGGRPALIDGVTELRPWSFWETVALNHQRPPKPRKLSALERDAFERADGAHSLADIVAEVGELHGGDLDGGREAAEDACREFVAAAVTQGWAVLLAHAWVPDGGWVAAGATTADDGGDAA